MKQVLQDRKSGQVTIIDVPQPERTEGNLLIRVHASVISAGTEGAMVAATGRSLLQRIADKPELIKKGFEMLKTRGIAGLQNQIEGKYAGYELLGYSCAGVVIESDAEAAGIVPGTRVACGGIGYATHAEIVSVPHRLCAVIPDGVSDETAAYTTLGSIAMQGVRQSDAVLGENIAVIGLGLVGLLAAQLLHAAGCNVIGIDPSKTAQKRGTENGCAVTADPKQAAEATLQATRGLGVDAVLICAATSSNDPIVLAGELARSRGRVVMVGATGMEVPREMYFRKELSFLLSRSYGPGRYDPTYEEAGIDYPVDFVRFTEQRNMQAFLDLAGNDSISTDKLTTHRFSIDDATNAYELLSDRAADRVGILLGYPHDTALPESRKVANQQAALKGGAGISFIGAGSYAASMLLPNLKSIDGASFRGVCTRQPARAASAASRFGFAFSASSADDIFADVDTDIVFIATRHDSHAPYAAAALKAGKHVWVEKPLALKAEEIENIKQLHNNAGTVIAVGFNRRFSSLSQKLLGRLPKDSPVMATYRVNAGHLPANHWTQDPATGGGRLLGEGCHFLDYLCFITRSEPVSVYAAGIRSERNDLRADSNFTVTVTFKNGSVGQLIYASEGSSNLSKERIEVFSGGIAAALDDFTSLTLHDGNGSSTETLKGQDKGQKAMLQSFIEAAKGGSEFPMSADAVFTSSLLTIAAAESLSQNKPIQLNSQS